MSMTDWEPRTLHQLSSGNVDVSNDFKLFDATNYLNKSSRYLTSVKPMFLPPNSIILDPAYLTPPSTPQFLVNYADLVNYNGNEAGYSGNATKFWSLDIEHWQCGYLYGSTTYNAWKNYVPPIPGMTSADSVVSDEQALIFMNYFVDVIGKVRAVRPDVVIGIYNEIPTQDASTGATKIAIDARVGYLAPFVDYVAPDLYITLAGSAVQFGDMFPPAADRIENWQAYALDTVTRARQYGKPVYIYLCPMYIRASIDYQLIEYDYWAAILETCYDLADGVIIWGGYDLSAPGIVQSEWDEEAEWWLATQEFIRNRRIVINY